MAYVSVDGWVEEREDRKARRRKDLIR